MELELFILLGVILFFAALVHGGIGFGFPMISTPLLALYLDIQTAVIYTLIPTLLVNVISIASEGKLLDALKQFWPLAMFAGVGSILGTLLLISFNSEVFKIILAIVILFYLVLDMVKIKMAWIREKPDLALGVFGIIAGLLGGLTNTMAPALIIYTLESKFSKKEIIQASNICFLVGKVLQIILFTYAGALGMKEANTSFVGLIAVAGALFIGVKIKSLFNPIVYKRVVKLLLLVIAIVLIIKYIKSLL